MAIYFKKHYSTLEINTYVRLQRQQKKPYSSLSKAFCYLKRCDLQNITQANPSAGSSIAATKLKIYAPVTAPVVASTDLRIEAQT